MNFRGAFRRAGAFVAFRLDDFGAAREVLGTPSWSVRRLENLVKNGRVPNFGVNLSPEWMIAMKLTAGFTITTGSFPGGAWSDFLKGIRARRTKRSTAEYPVWWVVRGNGYQIWVSEVCLRNSALSPPTWRILVESLATLNEDGQEEWQILISSLRHFLEENKLAYDWY